MNPSQQHLHPPQIKSADIIAFRRRILRFYRQHGRELPFRHTRDPYRITVAEFMLQQTQVERVIPKYNAWIKRWPGWSSLAEASRRQLLEQWSGLGYNRRAIYLGEIARLVTGKLGGELPGDELKLRKLPGIGMYTALAILIFAFGQRVPAIDINVRRVLLHEFGYPPDSPNSLVEELAWWVLPRKNIGEWHHALMDYGRLALPPRVGRAPAPAGSSRFTGSRRQIRGEIVRQLTGKSWVRPSTVAKNLECSLNQVVSAAHSLEADGLVELRQNAIYLHE